MQKEILILQENLEEKITQNLHLIKEREKEQKRLEEVDKIQNNKIEELQTIIDEYEQEIVQLEKLQEKSQELEEIKQEKNNIFWELQQQKELEKKGKQQIESLRKNIEILINQKDEAEQKIKDLQQVQISSKISIQEREDTIQEEFERQIKLIKAESQYAFEEAQQIEEEKNYLEIENQNIKDKLTSEIEKNRYLEFALETYKNGDNDSHNQKINCETNCHSIPTSYLTNISSRKLIKALKKLGFEKDRHNGDHFILERVQQTKITVSVPHPRQEVNPLTVKSILIQTNTSLEDFLNNL